MRYNVRSMKLFSVGDGTDSSCGVIWKNGGFFQRKSSKRAIIYVRTIFFGPLFLFHLCLLFLRHGRDEIKTFVLGSES